MAKGHVLGLEAFIVFLGWMLILSLVWSSSSHTLHVQHADWKKSRALETSIALSDTLILTHNTQPWKGCAVFDESLQRVRSYVVHESCLQTISNSPPPSPLIARVSVREVSHTTDYFSRVVDENAACVGVRRPIFLFPSVNAAYLEVLSCA